MRLGQRHSVMICFLGDGCGTFIDYCKSTPCQNKGTCLTHHDSYKCVCQNGFTGSHCETNVNECDSNPCQNGGQCMDFFEAYQCKCAAGTGVFNN